MRFSTEEIEDLKAAVAELQLTQKQRGQLTKNEPTFESRADVLLCRIPSEVWEAARIDRGSWFWSLKRHRNLVAHSSEQKAGHRQFMDEGGLRALRDAMPVVLIRDRHLMAPVLAPLRVLRVFGYRHLLCIRTSLTVLHQ